jgi:hypothetical protein
MAIVTLDKSFCKESLVMYHRDGLPVIWYFMANTCIYLQERKVLKYESGG